MSGQTEVGASSGARNRIGVGLFLASVIFLAGTVFFAIYSGEKPMADPDDPKQVARGKVIYDQNCASCHGTRLEGQPNWQEKLPNGRMPAPPHDASGHTWHHPDSALFGITKYGLIPGKYAPPKYQSDMPAFGVVMTDDGIWAVLAYIKSSWPTDIRKAQHEMTRERDRH